MVGVQGIGVSGVRGYICGCLGFGGFPGIAWQSVGSGEPFADSAGVPDSWPDPSVPCSPNLFHSRRSLSH